MFRVFPFIPSDFRRSDEDVGPTSKVRITLIKRINPEDSEELDDNLDSLSDENLDRELDNHEHMIDDEDLNPNEPGPEDDLSDEEIDELLDDDDLNLDDYTEEQLNQMIRDLTIIPIAGADDDDDEENDSEEDLEEEEDSEDEELSGG